MKDPPVKENLYRCSCGAQLTNDEVMAHAEEHRLDESVDHFEILPVQPDEPAALKSDE